MLDTYFGEPHATNLEAMRSEARAKRRIVYDCFHAIVIGDKVGCARGYFAKLLPFLAVLRGRGTTICAGCVDYNDGGENRGDPDT